MKYLVTRLAVLTMLLSACGPLGLQASNGSSATPTLQTNIGCHQLVLFLEPALAPGFTCLSIPEDSTQGIPAHIELSFSARLVNDSTYTARVDVYPLDRFNILQPDTVPPAVSQLQGLVSGSQGSDQGLPFLPVPDQPELFAAQYKVISFGSGTGIRYLTQFNQKPTPVNNQEMVYTFQGLSSDGAFWVSAVLPASTPMLAPDAKTLPGGVNQDQFAASFDSYIAGITAELNGLPSSNFAPDIDLLDGLVASIKIQP
jgi:hypothetical protein